LSKSLIITLIILGVLIIIAVVLYFLGKKAQKRQDEQQAQLDAMKQSVSMLVIDKKKMRLKDAGLPQAVIDQAPKVMRMSKLPIVKAKIGPQVLSLVCDANIFDSVPVKKEVKATISGIYITEVKGLHGKQVNVEVKKSKWKQFVEKAQEKAGAKPL
jgi:type II secretory pathway pseudopilin PulG